MVNGWKVILINHRDDQTDVFRSRVTFLHDEANFFMEIVNEIKFNCFRILKDRLI